MKWHLASREAHVTIRRWLTGNFLALKDNKTELIVFARKRQSHHAEELQLSLGDITVKSAGHVRNLGAYFDRELQSP